MVQKPTRTISTLVEVVSANVVTITIVAEVNSAVHKAVAEAYRANCGDSGKMQNDWMQRFILEAMRCKKHIADGKGEDDIREYAMRYWKAHGKEADAAMADRRRRKKFVALRVHDMWEEEIFEAGLPDLAAALKFKYRGCENCETTLRYMHKKE